jgi:hypothetical protein
MPAYPTPKLLLSPAMQALAEFFHESGYTEKKLQALTREPFPPAISPRVKSLLLDENSAPGTLTTLIRLFTLGVSVPAWQAETVLPEAFLRSCVDSGLITSESKLLIPRFPVEPVRGKLLVSDRPGSRGDKEDYVIGAGPVGMRLVDITPRTPVPTALDACTGGGIQTLFLADHCDSITSIDLNPRAVEFAAFNAALNGLENVELLQGDRLDPVRGRSFDLIVCDPPFYLGPTRRKLYSDNEMDLDEFSRQMIRECSAHLNEGGFLHVLFECAEVEGEPWRERLDQWFRGLGCDVWVRRYHHRDVIAYCKMRLAETPPADVNTLPAWIDYFRSAGVKQIHGGSVAIRRRNGANWTFFDDFESLTDQRFGASVPRAFDVRDYLAMHSSDESILGTRLTVCDETWIEEHSHTTGGDWSTSLLRLRLKGESRVLRESEQYRRQPSETLGWETNPCGRHSRQSGLGRKRSVAKSGTICRDRPQIAASRGFAAGITAGVTRSKRNGFKRGVGHQPCRLAPSAHGSGKVLRLSSTSLARLLSFPHRAKTPCNSGVRAGRAISRSPWRMDR